MKIIFFYQYFGTPRGSWSTRVYELTKRWVSEGHEVTVVTAPYDKSDIKGKGFVSRRNIEGINLIIINSGDSNRLPFLQRVIRACIFGFASIFYALTLKYDVLISSSGPITIGLPMILSEKLRRKPTVFEVRDLWPDGGIELGLIRKGWQKKVALWFEKQCYKHADLVVPCSPGMEASIRRRFPETTTLVITNASDNALFNNSDQKPDGLSILKKGHAVFLYAGSLGLMDDCGQIVKAMSSLKEDLVSLVFVGDGAERRKLEEEAIKTGNPNIYFLGLIPKTEVVKWFSVATASFVTFKDYPVLHTSSPNKMFDSFAAGVPIIQSTKGWIRDLVEREGCGINVDPHNAHSFADAMRLLVKDPLKREEMALSAKRLSLQMFNRDILAKQYLEGVEKITKS